jgi:hypothetical protein
MQRRFVIVSFNGASVLCLDNEALRVAARDFAHVRNAQGTEIAKLKPFDTARVVKRLYERRHEWNDYMEGKNDLSHWKAIVQKNHSKAHQNMLKLTH